jgi:hypothetical protein
MIPPPPEMRCNLCNEIIGVYEPMVVQQGDEARRTSQAAEPSLAFETVERFHRDCYIEVNGGTSP